MGVIEEIVARLRELSPNQREQVLRYVSALPRDEGDETPPLRSLKGMWKEYGIRITEEDIAEARREMWGNFPRDIEP